MQQILAENIRKLLRRNKMSHAELARRLDVKQSSAGRYARGERTPSLEQIVAIAEIFNVSLDWLITGKDSSKGAPSEQHRYTVTVVDGRMSWEEVLDE